MTIAGVSRKYGISQDTLRYYERIGLIPGVGRTKGGKREYGERDIAWVGFIKCMRSAGVTIEALHEYVALYQKGKSTIQQRKQLLIEQREQMAGRIAELQATLERLDGKIDGYEERMLAAEEGLRPEGGYDELT